MVFLVRSLSGLNTLLPRLEKGVDHLWFGAGVLSDVQIDELRDSGLSVSVLNYTIKSSDNDCIDDATDTIREHHPNELIFVEVVSKI
jgi:hypothetical protein